MKRKKGTSLTIPVVIGSRAVLLSESEKAKAILKGMPAENTHQWKLYVLSPDGRDMTGVFESVTFKLHESFAKPERVLTKMPYEVHESGWGEFEIQIKITLAKEADEKPVVLSHMLRLFHYSADPTDDMNGKPVISDRYDEIVVTNPTEAFCEVHEKWANQSINPNAGSTYNSAMANMESQQLKNALSVIQERLQEQKGRLQNRSVEVEKLRAKVKEMNNGSLPPRSPARTSSRVRSVSLNPDLNDSSQEELGDESEYDDTKLQSPSGRPVKKQRKA